MSRSLMEPAAVIVAARDEFTQLNALERKVAAPEAAASDIRWTQAEEVVRLLNSGKTQRQVAERWVSARTGKPYSHQHVDLVARTWGAFVHLGGQDRPPWNEAYHSPEVRGGAHVGNNSGRIEWYTPADYIAAARAVMGGIDLDPASCAEANEVVGATVFYSEDDDGLAHDWSGRAWMNPPYASPTINSFCAKLAEEYAAHNVSEAVVLTNNATETAWFHALAEVATAYCFPRGRISFWRPDIESKTPLQGQAVTYLGPNVERFRDEFLRFGFTVAP